MPLYSNVLKDVGAESWLEREILAQIERAFRKEDDIKSLERQYEKLLETYPRRVGIRRGYARVLADAGEREKATDAFREILKITPGDRANQEAFIALFLRIEDYEGARKQLESLIKQHPDDAELYVQLAELAAKTKAPEQAIAAADRFLEKSDQGEYDYLRAARLLERLELPDAAKAKYAALTEAFPESPSAKEARAAFLYKTGDKQEAFKLWRASAASGDAAQSIRVAKALTARQEYQVAYALLSEQVDQMGNDGLFLAQFINASLALKKYDEAIPLARKRVDLATTTAELDDAIAQGRQGNRTRRPGSGFDQGTPRRCTLYATGVPAVGAVRARGQHPSGRTTRWPPLLEAGDVMAVTQQIRLARLRHDWNTAVAANATADRSARGPQEPQRAAAGGVLRTGLPNRQGPGVDPRMEKAVAGQHVTMAHRGAAAGIGRRFRPGH